MLPLLFNLEWFGSLPGIMRSRLQKTLFGCGGVAGVAALLLGVVVLVGRYTGNRTLIQVMPSSSASCWRWPSRPSCPRNPRAGRARSRS